MRRTRFELNKAQKRAHLLEGLSVALANIDNSDKNIILHEMAETLRSNSDEILVENTKDMKIANKFLIFQ